MSKNFRVRKSIPLWYAGNSATELLATQGNLDAAEHICLQALDTEHVLFLGNPRTKIKVSAMNYGQLGNVYLLREKLPEAEKYYKEALKKFLEVDDHSEGIGITYSNLGAVYELLDNLSEALRCWTQARFVFSVIGDNWRFGLTDEWVKEIEEKQR
jgi:tetratricopeptide (TPR) repeat protein